MIFNDCKYNNEWPVKEFNKLGTISRGVSKHRPRNDDKLFNNGKYPLVQTGDVKESNIYIYNYTQKYNDFGLKQSKLWDEGTLCITIAANIAETAILTFPMCFPDSIVGFTADKNETSEEFMYYVFQYIKKSIKNSVNGSIQDNINLDYLKQLKFRIPCKDYQNKITDTLVNIDRKIEINNQINNNLEEQIKLLYDYWFTQFNFPDKNGYPYCSSGGKMIWNENLKRNIPVKWKTLPFLEVASWETNSQPPKSKFVYEPKDGYIRFIQNRDYDSDTHKTYIPLTKNLSVVDKYDILMDKYGDAGAVRYGIEGSFNVALGKISVHDVNQREYVRSFLESKSIYNYLHNSCMASTRASLSEANLSMLTIVIPEDSIIKDYNQILTKIRTEILRNKDESEKLTQLRTWLLPILMNGQATIE